MERIEIEKILQELIKQGMNPELLKQQSIKKMIMLKIDVFEQRKIDRQRTGTVVRHNTEDKEETSEKYYIQDGNLVFDISFLEDISKGAMVTSTSKKNIFSVVGKNQFMYTEEQTREFDNNAISQPIHTSFSSKEQTAYYGETEMYRHYIHSSSEYSKATGQLTRWHREDSTISRNNKELVTATVKSITQDLACQNQNHVVEVVNKEILLDDTREPDKLPSIDASIDNRGNALDRTSPATASIIANTQQILMQTQSYLSQGLKQITSRAKRLVTQSDIKKVSQIAPQRGQSVINTIKQAQIDNKHLEKDTNIEQ